MMRGYYFVQVFYAAAITLIIVVVLTTFAFQTKCDFTGCGVFVLVSSIVLLIFGIVCIFVPGKTLQMVYCSVGVLLFSFYIIYDTQIMIGGNHKYAISPDEYVFAALNLYIDVVMLFMYLLRLIGLVGGDE